MIFALIILGCLLVAKVLQQKKAMEDERLEKLELERSGIGGMSAHAAAVDGRDAAARAGGIMGVQQGGVGLGPTNTGQPVQAGGALSEGHPPALGP